MIENSPSAWTRRAETITEPHEVVLWSARGQAERFAAVVAAITPEAGETLIDYGCGLGGLIDHLPADVLYTGYDWASGMLRRASALYPKQRFVPVCPTESFDITVCIGPFNLPDGWSKEATWETLAELWDRTARVLAASLYAGADSDCLTYGEREASLFAMDRSWTWSVERHRPNDILLVLRR